MEKAWRTKICEFEGVGVGGGVREGVLRNEKSLLSGNLLLDHWKPLGMCRPVCFVFKRARAPRHFLLGKGHPMR